MTTSARCGTMYASSPTITANLNCSITKKETQRVFSIILHSQFSITKEKSSCPKTTTFLLFRQRPTLPGGLPPSTISAEELNFRVRNGNGWILFAIITGYFLLDCQLNNAKNLVLTHSFFLLLLRSSPRPISINQLNVSPHLHL